MNIFVVVLLGVLVSVIWRILNRSSNFTLGTVILGMLGAFLGQFIGSALFSEYPIYHLILPTVLVSITGATILVLLQKLLVK